MDKVRGLIVRSNFLCQDCDYPNLFLFALGKLSSERTLDHRSHFRLDSP